MQLFLRSEDKRESKRPQTTTQIVW